MVPEEPILYLVVLGQEMVMVVLGEATPTQFTVGDLLAEIIHDLAQFMVRKVAKLCLEMLWGFPTRVEISSGCMTFPLL